MQNICTRGFLSSPMQLQDFPRLDAAWIGVEGCTAKHLRYIIKLRNKCCTAQTKPLQGCSSTSICLYLFKLKGVLCTTMLLTSFCFPVLDPVHFLISLQSKSSCWLWCYVHHCIPLRNFPFFSTVDRRYQYTLSSQRTIQNIYQHICSGDMGEAGSMKYWSKISSVCKLILVISATLQI